MPTSTTCSEPPRSESAARPVADQAAADGAALGIDVAPKLTTGQESWTQRQYRVTVLSPELSQVVAALPV